MAKIQTRRSISVRGTTYDRLRAYCEINGVSMSEFVEARIAEVIGGAASKEAAKEPAREAKAPRAAAPAPAPTPKAVTRPEPARSARRSQSAPPALEQRRLASQIFSF